MKKSKPRASSVSSGHVREPRSILKKSTGIDGFDHLSGGGLPDGRLTAVVGGPGTGKSLFALQNLVHRFRSAGEPGVFVSFEEPADRIRTNLGALDWDVSSLASEQLALIDSRIPTDTEMSGSFDLAGLLAGLSARKADTGFKNVVFDGIDLLIGSLNDEHLERRELGRIDDWIRAEGVSAVVTVKSYGTGERDQKRSDLIQYITDCVVLLEGTLIDAVLSRTLRVVKYRGSGFSANAAPLVIGDSGLEVIPPETQRGSYPTYSERVSSGVPRLDAILDGGFIRGSSVLVTGAPGTAKTSLSASLTDSTCSLGRKALFVSFDESDNQIMANMKSIGIDLKRHVSAGNLLMSSLRSAARTPEECFLKIADLVKSHQPALLVVDPMSAFADTSYSFAGAISESLIDLAKSMGITFMATSLLAQSGGEIETSVSHVSTIADTWLHLSYIVQNGERNRALTIVKSRGTGHSNQVRELKLNRNGMDLVDVYVGGGSILLGSARLQKQQDEARNEKMEALAYRRRKLELAGEISEAEGRLRLMTLQLAAKQREAELEDTAERLRNASSHDDVAERQVMRRQKDDRGVETRRHKARSEKKT
jgi:circadian clock protein KaiC